VYYISILSIERTLFTSIFLKEYGVIIDGNMFTSRTIMTAIFTIAIASSLIVVSGGLVGSAFAKKASGTSSMDEDKSSLPAVLRDDSPKSSANAGDSSGNTGDTSAISAKDLKSLSKCESGAAVDGDLTQAEVTDCYRQEF
jgi:hypothetical protein